MDKDSQLNFGRLFQLIRMAQHPGNPLLLQKTRNVRKGFKIHDFRQTIFYENQGQNYKLDKLMTFLWEKSFCTRNDAISNRVITCMNHFIHVLVRFEN